MFVNDRDLFIKRYQIYTSLKTGNYRQQAFVVSETVKNEGFDGRSCLINQVNILRNLKDQEQTNISALEDHFDIEKVRYIIGGEQAGYFIVFDPKRFIERCFTLMNEISLFLNNEKCIHNFATEEEINLSMDVNKVLIFNFGLQEENLLQNKSCNKQIVLENGENLREEENNGKIIKGHIKYSDIVFKDIKGIQIVIEPKQFKICKNSNSTHYFVMIETKLLLDKGVDSVSIEKLKIKKWCIKNDLE